jgi:hypothetical protein
MSDGVRTHATSCAAFAPALALAYKHFQECPSCFAVTTNIRRSIRDMDSPNCALAFTLKARLIDQAYWCPHVDAVDPIITNEYSHVRAFIRQ